MDLKLLRPVVYFFGLLFIFIGCRQINKVFQPESARSEYAKALQDGPLAQNKIVQNWQTAGDSVLYHPVSVDVPFQTKVVYFNDEANAWAWKFSLSEGRTIRAHMAQSDTSHQVFIDLFSIDDGEPNLEKSAQDSMLSYTLDQSQTLVLRVQSELLVDGSATISITDNPSMEFPVRGGTRADIGSFWGDPRAGGSRQHKGVDIFAERGTPVVAAADGRVTRTGNRGLGGKQVWLRADGKSLYYAHLDSINSGMLEGVQKSDTLGFVGNSGNARTTPPHLHFGIYNRGAINPLPFIDFANTETEPITADPISFPKWGRISAPKANVRPLPSTEKEPFVSLTRNNPVKIIGGTGEWYQIELPDGRQGFLYRTLIRSAAPEISSISADAGNNLFKEFTDRQPLLIFNSPEKLDLHATYQDRQLVRYKNRWMWVNDE